MVRDQYGFVIQNAQVFVYQPGTTNVFLGTAYDAASGGAAVTNPFTTNAFGEVEAWFDTAQVVDVLVTDNSNLAYRAVGGVSDTQDFPSFTEKDDIYVSAVDQVSADFGEVGDISSIDPGDAAAAGATGEYADAGHQHANLGLPNSHSIAQHDNLLRTVFLPVNDGAVLDGGTLAIVGANPDGIRSITLADAASQGAAWALQLPDWASGSIAFQIFFTPVSAVLAANVRWSVDCKAVASAGLLNAAGTTTVLTHTGASEAVSSLIKGTLTASGVTPAAATDLFMINVRRLGADGADTFAGTIGILGVLLSYTATQ